MPPRRAARSQPRDVQIEPTGDDATLLTFGAQDELPRKVAGTKRRANAPPPPVVVATTSTPQTNLLSDYGSSDSDDNDDSTITRAPAYKRPTVHFADEPPQTHEAMLAQQETLRSAARSVHEDLRSGNIPFYDKTQDDAARTVIIDQPTFAALHQDSAFEFQDANRPPWVPSLPKVMLDRIRTWHVLETLTELDQRTKPWYTMVSLVAGFLKTDVDQLVVPAPTSASANAVRPTRNSVRGSLFVGNADGGGTSQIGLTGGAATTGMAGQPTPFRDDMFADFPAAQNVGRGGGGGLVGDITLAVPAGRGSRLPTLAVPAAPGGGGAAAPPPVAPVDAPPLGADAAPPVVPGGAAAAPPPPMSQMERLALATDATQRGMQEFSQGRFGRFRDERRNTEWYDVSNRPDAIQQSRDLRVAGAQAQTWITRPVATGIYYLNNNYIAARDEAFMLITSRADQLSMTPMEAFIAEDARDPVQFRVRTQFGKLIATLFNFHRFNSSRFVKLAHDGANYAAQSEDILRYFVNRITYDPNSARFGDTGARAAVNNQPPWQRRPLGVPSLPSSSPSFRYDPLLARPPPSRAAMSMLVGRPRQPF